MQAPSSLQRLRLYVAALWAGSAVTVALVATMLNRFMVDKVEFGKTVSVLFRSEALLGLFCGVILLATVKLDRVLDGRQSRNLYIVLGLLFACLVGYFVLQPMMGALREAAGPAGVMAGEARREFGMLHGLSMLLYLIQTILALFLVVKLRK